MSDLLPDDPSTLFLAGVVATMVGFWLKEKIDQFTAADRKVERKADKAVDQQSDIRADLREIETKINGFERRLENHDKLQELVTRLDERLANMTDELKRQPQVIALCVGEAIKAAFRYYNAAPAGR